MFFTVLLRPQTLKELKIVFDFRNAREKYGAAAAGRIDRMQYEWGARRSKVPAAMVREVVRKWMFEKPLRYLPSCRFEGVLEAFVQLRAAGIRIGVFSDYPAMEKLQCLGLRADVVVSADDEAVGRLKPAPEGLRYTAEKLCIPVDECLFIGDRDDKDGECARRAGMAYLIPARPDRYFSRSRIDHMTDTWRNSWKK